MTKDLTEMERWLEADIALQMDIDDVQGDCIEIDGFYRISNLLEKNGYLASGLPEPEIPDYFADMYYSVVCSPVQKVAFLKLVSVTLKDLTKGE